MRRCERRFTLGRAGTRALLGVKQMCWLNLTWTVGASLSRHSRKHQQRKESYLRSFGNDPGLTFPREERRFCVGDLSWEATFWNTPLRWEVTPHTLCCVIPPLNSSAPLLHFWRGAGARMSVVEEFQPRVIIVWRWISKETKSSCCNGSLSETLADNCVSARWLYWLLSLVAIIYNFTTCALHFYVIL